MRLLAVPSWPVYLHVCASLILLHSSVVSRLCWRDDPVQLEPNLGIGQMRPPTPLIP